MRGWPYDPLPCQPGIWSYGLFGKGERRRAIAVCADGADAVIAVTERAPVAALPDVAIAPALLIAGPKAVFLPRTPGSTGDEAAFEARTSAVAPPARRVRTRVTSQEVTSEAGITAFLALGIILVVGGLFGHRIQSLQWAGTGFTLAPAEHDHAESIINERMEEWVVEQRERGVEPGLRDRATAEHRLRKDLLCNALVFKSKSNVKTLSRDQMQAIADRLPVEPAVASEVRAQQGPGHEGDAGNERQPDASPAADTAVAAAQPHPRTAPDPGSPSLWREFDRAVAGLGGAEEIGRVAAVLHLEALMEREPGAMVRPVVETLSAHIRQGTSWRPSADEPPADQSTPTADESAAGQSQPTPEEADWRSASLREARLSHARLRLADLRAADLHGADLRSTDLRGAKLTQATLRGARLADADLGGAILCGADLREVEDLPAASLSGAIANQRPLVHAGREIPPTQWPESLTIDAIGRLGVRFVEEGAPLEVGR